MQPAVTFETSELKPAISFKTSTMIEAISFSKEESQNSPTNGVTMHPIEKPEMTLKLEIPAKLSTMPCNLLNERECIIDPLNAVFPESPIEPPQIYIPRPLDKTIFRKDNEIAVETEPNKISLASILYHKLLNEYKIRAYKEELFIFEQNHGAYKRLSDMEFDYIINRSFGTLIEQKGDLSLYRDIKEYVKKDFKLVVNQSTFQPLRYWAFENGLCDVYSKICLDNDGRYFVRNVLQCNFSPKAVCPIFDTFIFSISGGDDKIVNLLWEIIGYLLSNDTNAKSFFAFVGKKDTGKSLLAHVLCNIVGENGTAFLSASDFSKQFAVAELNGKTLNVCMDLPNRPLSVEAVASIKAITGNDMIHSDVKYKEAIHFRPTTRLLFGSNSIIKSEIYDSAFLERLVFVPFRFSVPKEKQDFDLERKLILEKEGICNKAIFYYLQLVAKKYNFTRVTLTEDISADIDDDKVILSFAEETCDFTASNSDKIFSSDLYESYINFCHMNKVGSLKAADFSRKFHNLFSDKIIKKKVKIGSEALNGFVGIKLKKFHSNNDVIGG